MAEVEVPNPEEVLEHAADRFTKSVALTVAIYAVALAITTLGGNNAAKEAMLLQQQSSNRWAHFQAKSSREYLAKIMMKRLKADKPDATELLAEYAADVAKYEKEKGDIEKEARTLEAERDVNLKKDPYFDFAEVLIQIAIVLASVSMLARSRPAYAVSIMIAIVGALLAFNGYTLMFNIPFLGGSAGAH